MMEFFDDRHPEVRLDEQGAEAQGERDRRNARLAGHFGWWTMLGSGQAQPEAYDYVLAAYALIGCAR